MNKSCFGKKQTYLLVMLLTVISLIAGAQGYNTRDWRFSNPQKFGFTVYDLDFVDNNNVIAVGAEGGIARSTDGGANWTYGVFTYTTPTGYLNKPAQLLDVHYVTPQVAYAVGSTGGLSTSPYLGGVLAKTSDGGITWNNVPNPLFNNKKNINTVWFVNKDTGYIAGSWNTADSIPKLYFTRNGGTTWDSLNAPIGGKTRLGYINNVNFPAQILDVTAKGKEIHRIQFINATTGYIIGGGQSHSLPLPAVNSSTCLPTGSNTSTSGNNAALIWKFKNGVLTDYSLSKERLGFSGINTNTVLCNTQYNAAQVQPVVQTYRALHMVNDSMILIVSANNNIAVRIYTGVNDSTTNLINGLKEQGRYQITSYPFPPTQGPNAQPPIPNPNNNLFSQPYHLVKAPNGTLYLPVGSSVFNPQNRVYTSADTGRTWVEQRNLPAGQNYSNLTTIALDIAPNGKFLTMGNSGVMADSLPGGRWTSTFKTVPVSASYERIEFADCNNGIATGSGNITVTTDGGKSWTDKARLDFIASNYTIGGLAYPNTANLYFAVSNGIIYKSTDQGTTLDPVYTNFNYRMGDVAAVGNDTAWACGSGSFSIATALRKPGIFRTINGGLNWTEYAPFTAGTNAQTFTEIEFPSRNIGYTCGTRDTIWKTTDGGTTWFKLPLPTPGVTPQITYNDMQALDDNTVIVVGNGFPRKVVFKTTDGGNTWTEIGSQIFVLQDGSNVFGLAFHDANNGYIAMGNGAIFKTTNGGTSWTQHYSPSSGYSALGFAPKKVPAGIPFQNHKLFAVTPGSANIMEFGDTLDVNVNSSEVVVNANCTNLTAGSITVTASGGLPPYKYSINGGAFQTSNVFSGLTQGPKTITITDAFCGSLTKTVNVGFTDNLVVTTNPVDTLVCYGSVFNVQASTNGTGATYSWFPRTEGLNNVSIANPVLTALTGQLYTVTATLNGCVRTANMNIRIKPNPVISAGPDKTIVEGDQTTLQGSGPVRTQLITWTSATALTGANSYIPTARPLVTTTYTLTVRDNTSCTATDNMVVTVLPYCLKVMDAFTPNADGQNDTWVVTNNGGSCTKQVYATVFNRYGNIVFKDDNYQNKWDGTYKGKPVADGTYYYVITYRLINGSSVTLKGDVTILR